MQSSFLTGRWAVTSAGLLYCLIFITGCSSSLQKQSIQTTTQSSTPLATASPTSATPQQAPSQPDTSEVEPEEIEPDDLIWQIKAGLALPQYDAAAIDRQIRWHLDNPNYLLRVWQRSQPYLYHIVSEVKQRGLPMELALLPIVESGYQPNGYSHARASGLWQFIPSTGQFYGLRQDWWSDQRRDVLASTNAALDYLQQLNNRFDGDWLMALAAYNAGGGRVNRAIRSSGKPRADIHFTDLKLSRETTTYIPKLLALARLIQEADEYGVELPVMVNEPYFSVVDIGRQTDLGQISDLAGITTDQLRKLNPALNRWATDPNGPHHVLVPVANASALQQGLEKLPNDERVRWRRHKIAAGESLGSIARKYGISVNALKESNRLNSNLIRAGKYLLVPSVAALPTHLAASCHGPRQVHRVAAGDTLWDIARQYNVGVNHLKRCNPGLSAGSLALNSTIKVREPKANFSAPDHAEQARVDEVVDYKVRRGDSLAAISNRFGVSVQQLVTWNQLNPKNYLQPGDRIQVRVTLLDRG